MRFDIF
jgi:hypothetical protein